MPKIEIYYKSFLKFLEAHPFAKPPTNLYEPADYIIGLGGKRWRPLFTLMGCDLFKDEFESALPAAMAVEVFHNFTLIHDDIMDDSDMRRGQMTVHKKYNLNTGILTGDMMMIKSYEFLNSYEDPNTVKKLLSVFSKMALEVCEGQQLDVDYETKDHVLIEEYIQMITLKTSVLLAASIQIGAILGGATESSQYHMYEFAKNFGIAFQLQDDFLDTFGDQALVGKKIGGDILRNKKTYLYLKSLELADDKTKEKLINYFNLSNQYTEDSKINGVKSIMASLHVDQYSDLVIEAYRDLSFSHLDQCNLSAEKTDQLKKLITSMIKRDH